MALHPAPYVRTGQDRTGSSPAPTLPPRYALCGTPTSSETSPPAVTGPRAGRPPPRPLARARPSRRRGGVRSGRLPSGHRLVAAHVDPRRRTRRRPRARRPSARLGPALPAGAASGARPRVDRAPGRRRPAHRPCTARRCAQSWRRPPTSFGGIRMTLTTAETTEAALLELRGARLIESARTDRELAVAQALVDEETILSHRSVL